MIASGCGWLQGRKTVQGTMGSKQSRKGRLTGKDGGPWHSLIPCKLAPIWNIPDICQRKKILNFSSWHEKGVKKQ